MDRQAYFFPPDVDDLNKPMNLVLDAAEKLRAARVATGKLLAHVKEFPSVSHDPRSKGRAEQDLTRFSTVLNDLEGEVRQTVVRADSKLRDAILLAFHSPLSEGGLHPARVAVTRSGSSYGDASYKNMNPTVLAFRNALAAQNVARRFASVDRSGGGAVSPGMTHTASSKKPLYGYDSMENSYLVGDYPYGARLRCKIRYWLEVSGSKGFRFCSQTEDPRNGRWNNPKKSTYATLAGCLYLDEKDHVQWDGLTEYSDGAKALDFVKDFPGADYRILKPFAAKKAKYLAAYAAGQIVMKVNGVAKPLSEEEQGRSKVEAEQWEDVAKHAS